MVNQKYNLLIIIRLKPNKKKLKRNDIHLILFNKVFCPCFYKAKKNMSVFCQKAEKIG